MTKFVALLGYPLGHSISPLFQQAAFDYYHLDVRYQAWEIEPTQLERTINLLRQSSVLGANVTIPHKEAVIPLLDEQDELVIQIGAANTIVNRDGKLAGYNTDAPAFIRALRQDGGFEPRDRHVVLLGAGGVARAASFTLVREGVKSLTISSLPLEQAEELAASLRRNTTPGTEIAVIPWGAPELAKALSRGELLVNCTPLGMRHSPTEGQSPIEAGVIPRDALVYDLVYNPTETPLLREAKKVGSRTLGGLPMLVYQGAASFELWTGREAPLGVMLAAARQGLEE